MILIVQVILAILVCAFSLVFVSDFIRNRREVSHKAWGGLLSIGFVTNFLDTLGIGSFAPQTALFKFFHLVEDRVIPGTLNVSNAIPVVLQAFIFLNIIKVEALTMLGMVVASSLGAVIGAGIVSRLPVKKIQLGLGAALLIVALTLFLGLMNWYPHGGAALGLGRWKLALAILASFALGSLHTIGIGFYAPCMALVYSLGMDPRVAFPIMMGSAAMLMPVAGMRFVRAQAQDRRASLAITLAGIIGVIIAAFFITSLPLRSLKWIVLTVLIYTSFTMFISASKS